MKHGLRCTEEVLEMVGWTLIGQAVLRNLAHVAGGVRLTLQGPGPRTTPMSKA